MIHRPVCPCRLRTSSASSIGAPQALHAGRGSERAARTTHLVSAGLLTGWLDMHSITQDTPDDCAASVSRRLVVRSNVFASPQTSQTTAPSASLASASAVIISATPASDTLTSTRLHGTRLNSANTFTDKSPASASAKSCCTQY